MATINFILQGKGGVGKSLISGFLAQYYQQLNENVICIDTDPNNGTFSSVPAYKATRLKLGDRPDEVNPRYFDNLMQTILSSKDEDRIIIDNGASTFLPLLAYLVENEAFNMIIDAGHTLYIHGVLAGGNMFEDTLDGVVKIHRSFPVVPLVIWENPFWGVVEKEGKGFENSKIYQSMSENNQIQGIIKLPTLSEKTFEADLQEILLKKKTFNEAIIDESFTIMTRHRLGRIWKLIFDQINAIKI